MREELMEAAGVTQGADRGSQTATGTREPTTSSSSRTPIKKGVLEPVGEHHHVWKEARPSAERCTPRRQRQRQYPLTCQGPYASDWAESGRDCMTIANHRVRNYYSGEPPAPPKRGVLSWINRR